MPSSNAGSSAIVVDASVAVAAVLPSPIQEATLDRFERWYREQRRLTAPAHWLGEATSVVRKQVFLERLSDAGAERALADAFDLGLESIPLDQALCHDALRWAARLRQARAYDGLYLALAERLDALFWTADQRLADGLRQEGVTWARALERGA